MSLHTRSKSYSPENIAQMTGIMRLYRCSGSLLLAAALVLGLGTLFIPSAAAQAPTTVAEVRVIHASPDTPSVDVYLDGEKTVSALSFTQAKGYLAVPAGTHQVRVFGQGATPATTAPLINVTGVTIPAGAQLSLVVEGLFADIRLSVVDDATTVPAAGKAKLRFVHAGPDVPAVNVSVKDGPVLYTNTQFGLAYPYQDVDAKRHDLQVSPTAGASNAAVTTGLTTEAGKAYSVYLMSLGVVQVFPDTAMLPAAAASSEALTGAGMPAANGAGMPMAATMAPAAATMVAVSTIMPPRTSAPVASVAPVATARVPNATGSGAVPTGVMLPVTGAPVADGLTTRLLLFAATLLIMGGITMRQYSARRWSTIHRH